MTKSGQTDRSRTTCGPEVDSSEAVAERSGSRRLLYLLLAALFFALGLIGIFLPLLPTTPLMLLTSYFLVRSYPPLNDRLLRSRLIGPVLRDWQLRRGVRRRVKFKSIVLVAVVVAASLALSELPSWLKIAIVAVASVGIIVILKLPSIDDSV
ncbi:MAG: hypothetical protein CMJ59_15950 [Planctomycetaceae bacterium]|nr:hypothetical protein [Planctomycetaceae bacterium]